MFIKLIKGFAGLLYRIYKIRFIYPFLTSIILLMVCFGFFIEALGDFYVYREIGDPRVKLDGDTFHFFLKAALKRQWIRLTAPRPGKEKESPLQTFYITVSKRDLDRLNADLPESGKNRTVTAFLKVDGTTEIKRVKMRYRGDNLFHWAYEQKSLRIRMRGPDLCNMEKTFNLLNPPQDFTIPLECIDYGVSRELGLLAPDYFPVRVFMNGRYMGVYSYVSQVDESLLRKHRRMPGSIYRGDGAPADKTGVSALWRDQKYWEKTASRSSEQKLDRTDIAHLIRAVNQFDHAAFYRFADTYLDKEKFYRFFAMDVVFGCGHHTYLHNHKLYFDPYKGKFEPIQWDMASWTGIHRKDFSYNPLVHRFKLNPILESQRDRVTWEVMGKITPRFIDDALDRYGRLIARDLAADIYKDDAVMAPYPFKWWVSVPFTMDEFEKSVAQKKATFKARRKFLNTVFRNAAAEYRIIPRDNGCRLIFKVYGNSGINVDLQAWPGGAVSLYRDADFNGRPDPGENVPPQGNETLLPGRKIVKLDESGFLSAKKLFGTIKTVNAPLYYSYIVETGQPVVNAPPLTGKNIVTGETVTVKPVPFDIPPAMDHGSDSIHPWRLPVPPQKEKILQGSVRIDKTAVFDQNTTVTVLPGTTFYMAPGRSLFFYGKVTAEGTPENPIRFLPQNPAKPWGGIVVQGPAASGSRFAHCFIEHGSVTSRNLIRYTGQLNLHDLTGFTVTHCTLGRNFTGDDSMHTAYADGEVTHCTFTHARADGLDIDIGNVRVHGCAFSNCGNDGLDIMTAEVEVSGNLFAHCRDKGISVGEWSRVELTKNLYYKCRIGIEVKDKSVARLDRSLITHSLYRAINLYNKNPRYDAGGTVEGGDITVIGDVREIAHDKKSRVRLDRVSNRLPDLSQYPVSKEPFRPFIAPRDLGPRPPGEKETGGAKEG